MQPWLIENPTYLSSDNIDIVDAFNTLDLKVYKTLNLDNPLTLQWFMNKQLDKYDWYDLAKNPTIFEVDIPRYTIMRIEFMNIIKNIRL